MGVMAAAAALPDLVILDRFVFLRNSAAAASSPGSKGYAPLTASSSTSQGIQFRIALRLADPPSTSRLYAYFPPPLVDPDRIGCNLLAAHGDLLLFGVTDEVKPRDPFDDRLCCQDHFLCRVTSPFLLKRLPEYTHRILVGKDRVHGHDVTMQRLFDTKSIGLLRGRDERKQDCFAVVHLDRICQLPSIWNTESVRTVHPQSLMTMREAEISVLRASASSSCDAADDDAGMWVVKRFPILHPEHRHMDICGWATNAVIPFKDYICWVDYYVGGILFFDVFAQSPEVSYLELPSSARHQYSYDFKRNVEMYRSVCVTGDGEFLKFVCVDREDGEFGGPVTSSTGFTVTSHVLKVTERGKMVWSDDASMKSDKVWPSICANFACDPEDILTFPLVSMEKADRLHFLFCETMDDDIDRVSVVTIYMNTERIVSIDPYIKGGDEDDTLEEKCRLRKSFLPSKFPPATRCEINNTLSIPY